MSVKIRTVHHLEFLNLKETVHARLSLHLSKCHIVGFLFDLILYVPSTIFQLYRDGSSWVEPVLS